jgi:hypothetical protein
MLIWSPYLLTIDLYESGKALVVDHKITTDGWISIAYYLIQSVIVALATAVVLFTDVGRRLGS